jgi:hypothetical protein
VGGGRRRGAAGARPRRGGLHGGAHGGEGWRALCKWSLFHASAFLFVACVREKGNRRKEKKRRKGKEEKERKKYIWKIFQTWKFLKNKR